MRTHVPLAGPWWVALELPAGWEIGRLAGREETIVARPSGEEPWFFGVSPVELGVYSLWAVAEAAMRKHVGRDASFDLFPDLVDGRGAFFFDWTDGVLDVGTWWLQLGERLGARVEYCDPKSGLLSTPRLPPPRVAARPLIAGLSFSCRE